MEAFTAFLSVVAVLIQCQTIQATQEEGLGRVISEAETQSQLIAAEINQWILTEGSEVQSEAVIHTNSAHSREKRTPKVRPHTKKISKHRTKNRKSKHIVSKPQKRSKKLASVGKKTSKKSLLHQKVIKLPRRLHVKKSGLPKGNKTHLTRDKVKKKTNVNSSKRATKISKGATHLKSSKTKVQSRQNHKKSTIPGTAQEKQQKQLREKSTVAKINPRIIKVFRKFPRKTLASYLQKKGVSERYIKVIIKQVKKSNESIHKNKTKAKMEDKKQSVDERKRKISVKKSHIPRNRDGRKQKVKDPANDTSKHRKAAKMTLNKHAKHIQKQKYSSPQQAKKRKQKAVALLKNTNKRRNSSSHAHILAKAPKAKLARLKHKIRKANNLKLRVAKALLSHCETQNRLKKVFANVNKSLRKAAKLARAIGEKFGIKKEDIDDITSEHTRDAVEEFLGKLF